MFLRNKNDEDSCIISHRFNWLLFLIVSFLNVSNVLANSIQINRPVFEKSMHASPIVMSLDDRFVWVVNPDLDTVTVLRTDTNEVISIINVGDEPSSLAITPDGHTVYVANTGANSVTVIKVINDNPNKFKVRLDLSVGISGELITGAEPRSIVMAPNGKYVFVANSSQDTISVISTKSNKIIDALNLKASLCNKDNKDRHFQPTALAVTADNNYLYTAQYLSYTLEGGTQRDDFGKEGIVCKVNIVTRKSNRVQLSADSVIRLSTQDTGFFDSQARSTFAFPNQLHSIVIRDNKAYLANIAASPSGPQSFDTITQSYVNIIDDLGGNETDLGAINLHLGGRDPEVGKKELYFSNPIDIAFTHPFGAASAYVVASGSDIIVKLKVDNNGILDFTLDADTTRYIDLNDPDMPSTQGENAGKNPKGIVINHDADKAYVLNYVSRNISIIDLTSDEVIKVVQVESLPEPGSLSEKILVGAEMFYSSRGNFVAGDNMMGSNRDRLSEKGRQNCASCHPRGLTDGIVWQFATGPRKTIAINGTFNPHDVSDQRIINASAIFDEVEDADFNTRKVSSKGSLNSPLPCLDSLGLSGILESTVDPDHGLLLADWGVFDLAACVLNSFNRPNSNRAQPYVRLPGSDVLVKSHDALIDWQRYAIRTPNRPMTRTELKQAGAPSTGGLNAKRIKRGEKIFQEAGCSSCHSGGKWTASRKDFLSPPNPEEIATEVGADNANQFQYLSRFLNDIGSYNLNVSGNGNLISGYPAIGGIEKDNSGLDALGFDYNDDGKGSGYNISSILGILHTGPYYHNGACETLECVLSDKNHRRAGVDNNSDPLNRRRARKQLVEYLKSIDEKTSIFN